MDSPDRKSPHVARKCDDDKDDNKSSNDATQIDALRAYIELLPPEKKEYFELHGISEFLQSVYENLTDDLPTNPYEVISEMVRTHRRDRGQMHVPDHTAPSAHNVERS